MAKGREQKNQIIWKNTLEKHVKPALDGLTKNEHGWILTYSITKFCFENEAFYMADDSHSDLKKLMMSMCKFWLPDNKSGVREILGSCQNGHVDTGFFLK